MNSNIVIFLSVLVGISSAAPGFFYGAIPVPSSDTKVYRDFLGNQATSYAYQDGHSSAVSLTRSDVSKHLVAAPAPVVYEAPTPIYEQIVAPAPVYAHHAPLYTSTSYQYHNRYPSYTSYHSVHPAFASYY